MRPHLPQMAVRGTLLLTGVQKNDCRERSDSHMKSDSGKKSGSREEKSGSREEKSGSHEEKSDSREGNRVGGKRK